MKRFLLIWAIIGGSLYTLAYKNLVPDKPKSCGFSYQYHQVDRDKIKHHRIGHYHIHKHKTKHYYAHPHQISHQLL
jgi:hypothetical protein